MQGCCQKVGRLTWGHPLSLCKVMLSENVDDREIHSLSARVASLLAPLSARGVSPDSSMG